MGMIDDHPDPEAPKAKPQQKFVKWKGRGTGKEVSADEILKERAEQEVLKAKDMVVEEVPAVPPIVDDDVAAAFEASEPSFTRVDMRPQGVNMRITPNVQGLPPVAPEDGFAPPDLSYKTARTLTDWLAICPGLRQPWETHPYRVRVERLTPKVFGGMRVGGFLGYERAIDDEQFAIQYGGERFRLTLEGPDPRGVADPMTGLARIRTLATMELDVPGSPNLQKLPLAVVAAAQQHQMEGTGIPMQPFSPFAPPQQYPQQQQQRMDSHEARGLVDVTRELLKNSLRDRSNGADGAVLEQFGRMSSAQIEAAKEMAAQQNKYLADQLAEERRRASAMETRLSEIQKDTPQNRMIELALGGKMSNEETERIRREYEDKLDRQRRDHEAILSQRETQWQLRIDQAKGEWERREESLRTEASRKEADMREATERRERDTRDNYENKLRLDREMYESRMKDQTRDHERSTAMTMENHRREIDGMRRDNERDQKTQKQMSEMLVHAKDGELDRLRSENATFKIENESLKREVYKPFAEKLAEGKQVGEMLGMVSAADAAAPDKDEKLSAQLVKMAVDKAPEFLRAFMPVIGAKMGLDPAQMGIAQPPAGLLPNGPGAQQQPQGQPPQQGGQRRRQVPAPQPRRVAPEPIVNDDDQFGVSREYVSVQGAYSPPPPVPMEPVPPPPPQQGPPPAPQHEATVAPQQEQAGPPPQVMSETDKRLTLIASQIDAHLNGAPPFSEEILIQFATQATQARKSDVEPKAFAAAFVAQVGDFAFMASDWIKDADGAWMLLELITRGTAGWSMGGPKIWVAEMLVELRRLKDEKAASGGAAQPS